MEEEESCDSVILNLEGTETPPEATKWKTLRVCCGKHISLVMPSDRLFCEHWEMNLFMPIFVFVIVGFCFLSFMFSTLPSLESLSLQRAACIQVLVSLVLFMWSYVAAMCMDPGFLPYDWAVTRKTKYSWQDQLDGLAIRHDQFEYAERNKPPFASFSHQAGRFVIRGDHICGWVSNWIGKRNHKQFMLMTLWGTVLAASLIGWQLMRGRREHGRDSAFWCDLVALCIEAIFTCVLFYEFVRIFINLCKNRTQIQEWQGVPGEYTGFCNSFKQVCGNNVFMWLCPTPAFGDDLFLE